MSTQDFNVLTPAAIRYAVQTSNVDKYLLNIACVDGEKCNSNEAKEHFDTCLDIAKGGSPLAMTMVAGFYLSGYGTRESVEKAIEWLDLSISAGFAPAHFELGMLYEEGIGVPKDLTKALECYELAISGKFGFAALHMALMFHDRDDVRDNNKAINYAALAYELGEISAAGTLGAWYEDGSGISRNEDQSVYWYKRAAIGGDPLACMRLSMAHELGQLGLTIDHELSSKYQTMYESNMTKIESSGPE